MQTSKDWRKGFVWGLTVGLLICLIVLVGLGLYVEGVITGRGG